MPAPVAAAGFAVPLSHAFPFFAVSENSAAGFDLLRLFTSRNAVNGRHDIGRTALRTQTGRFTYCLASFGRPFHCDPIYPESLHSARQFAGLFAELSERFLNQLDGGRGIENLLLIQVDIFDAVLAAVGGGNLLFRDIDP